MRHKWKHEDGRHDKKSGLTTTRSECVYCGCLRLKVGGYVQYMPTSGKEEVVFFAPSCGGRSRDSEVEAGHEENSPSCAGAKGPSSEKA